MKNLFLLFIFLIMVLTILVSAQDGVEWSLYDNNPVFSQGAGTAWDRGIATAPMVAMFKDTLRMWYEGSTVNGGYGGVINIGYAWSLDGITWHRKTDSPVLSARIGNWDYPHVAAPSVFVDVDTLRMWYGGGKITGKGMRIGYAVSIDGINWTRYPDPVMETNKPWNKDGVVPGGVLKEGGVFKMWFNGGVDPVAYPTPNSRWSVGFATSPDGIHWTLSDEPVLQHGSGILDYDRDLVLCGTVIKTSKGYEMWYSGSHKNGSSSLSSIGYASSSDGIIWEKYEKDPVLKATSSTSSFGNAFYNPHVVFNNGRYQMWFSAWHPGPTIGYANSVVTDIENDLIQLPEEYNLFQNYPNPFNPSTIIKYSIPERSFVSLKVYDVLGREVADLVEKIIDSGKFSITFNSNHSANRTSGVYFYTLCSKSLETNKENRITKKMILLK